MGERVFDQVRSIALALPGVSERVSHGEPCFFVSTTRALCYYYDNHNGDDGSHCGVPCRRVHDELVNAEPGRYFNPPVSARGTCAEWVGVFPDTMGEDAVDWDEVAAIVENAFRLVAPRTLIAELERRR